VLVPRAGDDLALNDRHDLRWELDTQVATGNHDSVACVQDLVDRPQRFGLFDLG
jgi:hypothetical protein